MSNVKAKELESYTRDEAALACGFVEPSEVLCSDKSNAGGVKLDPEMIVLKGDADGAHFEIMLGGAIKIEVGGSVHVRTVREWHALAVAAFQSSTASKDERELYISDLETTVRHCADLLRAVHYNVVADYGTSGDGIIAAEKTLRDVKYFVEHGMSSTRSAIEHKPAKVFVVIGGWDYEGYSEPTGIYSTREKAEAAKDHALKDHSYDKLEILEYDLDIGELENDASPDIGQSRG